MGQLARRALAVQPSATLGISQIAADMRAAGQDVISLSAGEPDFDMPDHVKEAAVQAIRDGCSKYTPVSGTKSLKEAVMAKFANENKLSYGPDQILVSAGCKHSIHNVMQATLNPGDEVIIPVPYWTSYPDMAALSGAQPIYLKTNDELKINPETLSQLLNEHTRMIILNNPSNPSGIYHSGDELKKLAEVLLEHPQVLILSDDIYEHILWGTETYTNILNVCPDLASRCFICNGVSKSYAMTGWRIGYAAGPVSVISAMTRIQSQSTSCACAVAQAAAEAAMLGPQDEVHEHSRLFKERHDYMYDRLRNMPGIKCQAADGTFYLFPDCRGLINKYNEMNRQENDTEFSQSLLVEKNLAVVPGSAFGMPGYARLSFAMDVKKLTEAMDRLEDFARQVWS